MKSIRINRFLSFVFLILSSSVYAADENALIDAILDCDVERTQTILDANRGLDLGKEFFPIVQSYKGTDIPENISCFQAVNVCQENAEILIRSLAHYSRHAGRSLDSYSGPNGSLLYWAIKMSNPKAVLAFLNENVNPEVGKDRDTPLGLLIQNDFGQLRYGRKSKETGVRETNLQNWGSLHYTPGRLGRERNTLVKELIARGAKYDPVEVFTTGSRGSRETVGGILSSAHSSSPVDFFVYFRPLHSKREILKVDGSTSHNLYELNWESRFTEPVPGQTISMLNKQGGLNEFAVSGFTRSKEPEGYGKVLVLGKEKGDEILISKEYGSDVIYYGTEKSRRFDLSNIENFSRPILIISQGASIGAAAFLIDTLIQKNPEKASRIHLIQASPKSAALDWDDNYARWTQSGVSVVIVMGDKDPQSHQKKNLPECVRSLPGRIREVIGKIGRENPEFLFGSNSETPIIYGMGSLENASGQPQGSFMYEAQDGLEAVFRHYHVSSSPVIRLNVNQKGYSDFVFHKELKVN